MEEGLYQDEQFRDRISTVTKEGRRNWIYALKPGGLYYKYRTILSYTYLIMFFVLPFMRMNGSPVFMLNFVESRFIVFGKIFWPQDFFILALAMVTLIVFIALFTVIYGRLFCGWTCPQTVFLEFVFRRIEWWIEGSPARQRALNEGPWTSEKLIKKTAKHSMFLLFSFMIAHTFLAYIIGVDEVWRLMHEPLRQHIGLIAGLVGFTALFYAVFAFVREIVCTTICPYGRLQGVLYDKDTMQIAYDYSRGEPKGRYKKNEARTAGNCIDCKKCVMVCPTGIDIRDGVQMDCVGCTACIDACDEVMDKVGFRRGLIRYASENQIAKQAPFHFSSRMKAYSGLLVILIIGMAWMIATRNTVDTYISRIKGQLYQEVAPDKLGNLFEAKIINKTKKDIRVELKPENFQGEIKYVGTQSMTLNGESINDFTFFLEIPSSEIHQRSNPITIGVYAEGKLVQKIRTKFLGPFN